MAISQGGNSCFWIYVGWFLVWSASNFAKKLVKVSYADECYASNYVEFSLFVVVITENLDEHRYWFWFVVRVLFWVLEHCWVMSALIVVIGPNFYSWWLFLWFDSSNYAIYALYYSLDLIMRDLSSLVTFLCVQKLSVLFDNELNNSSLKLFLHWI